MRQGMQRAPASLLLVVIAVAFASIVPSGGAAGPSNVRVYVSTLSPADSQTVSGSVKWETKPTGPSTPCKVVFFVDGVGKWTEYASPYVFNGDNGMLDTTTLANGRHTLKATAYTSSHEASSSIVVTVSNSAASAPANTALPTVSGTPQVGQNLTAARGVGRVRRR